MLKMADRKHFAKPDKRRMSEEGGKKMIWVYPPNNWVSNYNETFVYGWCEPKAKLFVEAGFPPEVGPPSAEKPACTKPIPVRIFPNGNFAQSIKLPDKKNIVSLIQILNGKKKVVSRNVIADTNVGIYHGKSLKSKKTKKEIVGAEQHVCPLRVIIIDPGHGGKEHGTHSPKGIPEKVFNLEIAKLLFNKLRRRVASNASTVQIYLTRTNDKDISLKQRIDFAKKKKCNLFISIHHNALPDNENPLKHRGVGVYYTHDFVKPLAKNFLDSISREAKMKKYGIFKRDFAVTRPDFYTGILIECGFLIHPEEGEYVIKKAIQEKIVRGIIKSL